jgi:hypothetical protein
MHHEMQSNNMTITRKVFDLLTVKKAGQHHPVYTDMKKHLRVMGDAILAGDATWK